jgi:hypothetical protein
MGSNALARQVVARQRYGNDLIVHVGCARYASEQATRGDPNRAVAATGHCPFRRQPLFSLRSVSHSPGGVALGARAATTCRSRGRLSAAHRCHLRARQGRAFRVHGRVARLGVGGRAHSLENMRIICAHWSRRRPGCSAIPSPLSATWARVAPTRLPPCARRASSI